jgi:hypothetical protein
MIKSLAKKMLLNTVSLSLFCLGLGCGGSKPPPVPPPAVLSAPTDPRTVSETFDPASLQEDLLLIQPGFPPPRLHQTTSTKPSSGMVEDTAALTDILPDQPVYSVQVMALSDAQKARQRADVLGQMIEVPVAIVAERGLFLIRAGSMPTLEEAVSLKERITTHFPAYAGAFVFDGQQRLEVDEYPVIADTVAADIILIRLSGWRILLDQFLSYEEAAALKKTAVKRLQRTDVDISFEAPWYKVKIGHFRTDRDAHELFELVQRRRFTNALKVRGEIQVPQEAQ